MRAFAGAWPDEPIVQRLVALIAWEIAIKKALCQLDAPENLEAALVANRFLPLPITIPHALAIAKLPLIHSDPFDRLLIAQARHEGYAVRFTHGTVEWILPFEALRQHHQWRPYHDY